MYSAVVRVLENPVNKRPNRTMSGLSDSNFAVSSRRSFYEFRSILGERCLEERVYEFPVGKTVFGGPCEFIHILTKALAVMSMSHEGRIIV